MTQDELKQAVARDAIAHVVDDAWIGVGSGSTANFFIDELAKIKGRIKGAVASSVRTAERLKSHGIPVDELNNVGPLPVYVDGADEVTEHGAMTAAVYTTSADVLAAVRTAALDAGVALSENLTGQVFVNQSAAFSDYHGTGANPAANATFTDGAFVASRFRMVQSRRHV